MNRGELRCKVPGNFDGLRYPSGQSALNGVKGSQGNIEKKAH